MAAMNTTHTPRVARGCHIAPVSWACVGIMALMACGTGGASRALVERFESSTDAVLAGEAVSLSWSVRGADRLQVIDGEQHVLIDYRVSLGHVTGDVAVHTDTETTFSLLAYRAGKVTRRDTTVGILPPARQPQVIAFEVSNPALVAGQSAILSWDTQFATQVNLYADGVVVMEESDPYLVSNSHLEVFPTASTTYRLEATGLSGFSERELHVGVSPRAVIDLFTVDQQIVSAGESVEFTWRTTDTESVEIRDSQGTPVLVQTTGESASSGSLAVALTTTGSYVLNANNAFSSAQATVVVDVIPQAHIVDFSLSDIDVQTGDSLTLSFDVQGAETITITDPDGTVTDVTDLTTDGTGVRSVTATTNGVFLLDASNIRGAIVSAITRMLLVSTPAPSLQMHPPSAPPESLGRLAWSAPGSTSAELTPAPDHQFVLGEPFASIENTGTQLQLSDAGDAEVVSLGFDFDFAYLGYDAVSVSYIGFLRFGLEGLALPTPGNVGRCVSPMLQVAHTTSNTLWSSGRVFREAQGIAPNRRVVIEWNRMNRSSRDPTLSFQAIINESGDIEYAYRVDQVDATATSHAKDIAVGLCSNAGITVVAKSFWLEDIFSRWSYSILFEPSDVLHDRSVAIEDSRLVALPVSKKKWQLVADYGEADRTIELRSADPEGVIRELMYQPGYGVLQSEGEWFELANLGEDEFDLEGWHIEVNGMRSSPIPPGAVSIAPGGVAVLAANGDPAKNGGFTPDYVYERTNELAMVLVDGGMTVQMVYGLGDRSRNRSYLSVVPAHGIYIEPAVIPSIQNGVGASVAIPPGCESRSATCCRDQSRFCLEATEIEVGGNRGTPGSENRSCAPTGSFGTAMQLNGGLPLSIAQGVATSDTSAREGAASVYFEVIVGEEATLVAESFHADRSSLRLWSGDGATLLGMSPSVNQTVLPVGVLPGRYIIEEVPGLFLGGSQCAPTALRVHLEEAVSPPAETGYSMAWESGGFEDISGSPDTTALPSGLPKQVSAIVFGFTFPFYDRPFPGLQVHPNGQVRFIGEPAAGKNLDLTELNLERASAPENYLRRGTGAVFWDNLAAKEASELLYATRTDGESRCILQWENWDLYNNLSLTHLDGATLRFQAVFFENGIIEYRYHTMDDGVTEGRASGASATVGIINSGTPFDPYQAGYLDEVVAAGSVLRFAPNR